jgi:hypothetical protein
MSIDKTRSEPVTPPAFYKPPLSVFVKDVSPDIA